MAHPMIIAVVGIDGAGKSTNAKWLASWLSSHGVRAAYFGNPSGRLFMTRLAKHLGRTDGIDLLGYRAYLVFEAVVRWVAIARALVCSRVLRRVAVMDRYSYCQYAVMRVRGGRGEKLARTWYAPFRRPDLACFLSVAPTRAQRRIRQRGIDTEDLSYLRALDSAYRSLPEFRQFATIDANNSLPTVRAALSRIVAEAINLRDANQLHQHFDRGRMTQERRRTRGQAVGTRLEDRDQVADLRVG